MKNLRKKGVSLIAVLLFMLVATIAATATFKWLSSSGTSSGSRMMQKEAYQSAIAGLENARTWMTYHANDVGSLIKQYKDGENGSVKPIKLNSRLKDLARAGQDFDVWLAGVNTDSSTYKLKILSSGKARNGSVHNEVGIFNVDGLYQVKKPMEKVSAEVDFEFAYFGGSSSMGTNSTAESMIVNGDLAGVQISISKNLVVTGNLSTQNTNHVILGGDVCVGGDLVLGNQGLEGAKNLYVNGKCGNFSVGGGYKINGDTYFNGDVTWAGTGTDYVEFSKNVTFNGSLTLSQTKNYEFKGDLCLTENGSINFSSTQRSFKTYGHTWVPSATAFSNNTNSGNVVFDYNGGHDTYIQGASGSGQAYKANNTSFTVKGAMHTTASGNPEPPLCAAPNEVKESCLAQLGEPTTGCSGTKYKVPDILKAADYNGMASHVNACVAALSSPTVTELNNCYKEATDSDLYGGYLVVKGTPSKLSNLFQNNSGFKFKGRFIILLDESSSLGADNCLNSYLQETEDVSATEKSFVFLYLPQGASCIRQGGSGTHRYFIYSLKDIGTMRANGGSDVWTGSIYLSQDNCSKVGNFEDVNKLVFDEDLVNDLAASGIICSYEQSKCGAGGSISGAETETSESEVLYGTLDSSYVANAPQLSVTLESQYKATEDIPDGTGESFDLKEDFIVLPRVIYMTTNPYGKLSDYYNVLPLNGANITQNDDKASCDIPTKDFLYDRSGSGTPVPLGTGVHVCSYTDQVGGVEKKIHFYVYVTGSAGSGPNVSFTERFKQVSGTYTVQANVPAHEGTLTLKVQKPDDSNWKITPIGTSSGCESGVCTFSINTSGTISLFNVEPLSEKGTIVFQILPGEGYTVGDPGNMTVFIASSVPVTRVDVDNPWDYCGVDGVDCPSFGESDGNKRWPFCNISTPWIKADNGIENNCTATPGEGNINKEWSCGTAGTIKLVRIPNEDENKCIFIIPEKEIPPSDLSAGNTVTLNASAMAKPMTFTYGFAGREYSNATIYATIVGTSIKESCSGDGSSATCSMIVFPGEEVQLTFDGEGSLKPEKFNFWSCEGASCPSRPISRTSYSIVIGSDNNKVLAHFDEKDEHCYFDEFKTGISSTSNSCDDDYCIGTNGEKWTITNADDLNKIEYSDGYIAAKQNKNDKTGIKIMSTAVAGLNGTLKAQFQVPRVATQAEVPTGVKNSGIILRSDKYGDTYLLLTLYANNSGYLTAMLCKQDGSDCITKQFSNNLHVYNSNSIVTLSVEMNETQVSLAANVSSSNGSATFKFGDGYDGFSAYQNVGEYTGFRLADPNFKIFDIGWRSDDYGADCWDTYPTVNCSFKAAYAGGVVPMYHETGRSETSNKKAKPWVALSSWFDDDDCSLTYYYKGTDACNASESEKTVCPSDGYDFKNPGKHVYISSGDTLEAAWAGMNCNTTDADINTLISLDTAFCGNFWVGEYQECSAKVEFVQSMTDANSVVFTAPQEPGYANLRAATLKLEINNANSDTVEIYLTSMASGENPVHSKSYVTTASGSISINVEDISDADNFDPEHVTQVVVNFPDNAVTVTKVYTICPNELSLSCNTDLQYSAGAWTFSVTVNNPSQMSGLEYAKTIGTTPGDVTSYCSGDCEGTDVDDRTKTYKFTISDANVYTNPNTYQFQVTLTPTISGKSVPGSPCNTNPVTISKIKATCNDLSSSSIKMGNQAPAFGFSIENCPSTGCPYTVSLVHNGTSTSLCSSTNCSGIPSSNGGVGGSMTPSSNPDDIGTYTYKLESTNEMFEGCSKEFTVSSNITGTCPDLIGYPGQSASGTLSLSGLPASYSSVSISMSVNSESITSTSTCSTPSSCGISIMSPDDVDEYTYTLKVGDQTLCTNGKLSVKNPLTCSVSPAEIILGNSFTFTPNYNGNCSSMQLTGDGAPTTTDCKSSYTITPTAENNESSYTLAVSGDIGDASCTEKVKVKPVPVETCECSKYCSNCSKITTSPRTINGDGNYYCIFFTSASSLNINPNNKNKMKINGATINTNDQCNSVETCDAYLEGLGIKKVNGGYFIDFPEYNYISATLEGDVPEICGGSTSSASTTSSSSAAVSSSSAASYCSAGATEKEYACSANGTNSFETTGAVCLKIKGGFGGWGFSNSNGRQWRVNGGSWTTSSGGSVDATSDGYVYIDITSGSFTYAAVYWYNCK